MELKKKELRFQECPWWLKLWRYRWYVPIPFKWAWLMTKRAFCEKYRDPEMPPSLVYGLMIGDAQCAMKWYYTTEEVMERVLGHKKKYEELRKDLDSLG